MSSHARKLITVVFVSAASAASAAEIEYSVDVPMARTNWATTASLPQFDPALGDLEYVNVFFEGEVEGNARFHNLNATPAHVTTTISAAVMLEVEPSMLLIATAPTVTRNDDLAPFDGTITFSGPSGRTYTGLYDAVVEQRSLSTLNNDLSRFIGTGTVAFPVTSRAQSSVHGPGNLIAQFETFAAADVTVVYGFSPVPEPATIVLLAMATALVRGRRRAG